jgi:hypothetical protein
VAVPYGTVTPDIGSDLGLADEWERLRAVVRSAG